MFTQPLLIYILSSNAILTRRIKKIIMIDNKNKILFFFKSIEILIIQF